MFKKLLTVGALAAGIALTGGIGTALAADKCPNETPKPLYGSNGSKWERIVVNNINNFASSFEQKYNGKTIKWYLKSKPRDNACLYNGNVAYYARYEGRIR